jgi:hypothetical protein
MGRFLKLFASRSFTILLFHLGLLFLMWPLISIPAEKGGPALFAYIFIVWAVLVFLLLLIGTSTRLREQKNKDSGND